MTTETIEAIFDNFEKTVLETCDIWDTDYSSVNWEPEFMTIFGTWQLIVTLDSIRNSCDVFFIGIETSVFGFLVLAQTDKWCKAISSLSGLESLEGVSWLQFNFSQLLSRPVVKSFPLFSSALLCLHFDIEGWLIPNVQNSVITK